MEVVLSERPSLVIEVRLLVSIVRDRMNTTSCLHLNIGTFVETKGGGKEGEGGRGEGERERERDRERERGGLIPKIVQLTF